MQLPFIRKKLGIFPLLSLAISIVILLGVLSVTRTTAHPLPQGDDTCLEDTSWIDPYLEEIKPRLIAERKYCQKRAITGYRSCLEERVYRPGLCKEEAIADCQSVYDQIPENDGGGIFTHVDNAWHWWDNDNLLELSYDTGGGYASGRVDIEAIDDFFDCSWRKVVTLEGTYSPESCRIRGTGTEILTSKPSVEGGYCGTYDPYEKTVTWGISVEDGLINLCAEPGSPICDLIEIPGYVFKGLEQPPSFWVSLICSPARPQVEQAVTCKADLEGANPNEDIEYSWYLDSAKEADTREPTWTWGSAEEGLHDITVYVQGEDRNTESTMTIEVGEEAELVASIGMDPPIPVLEQGVTFTPSVQGAKANETLSYLWFLDGNLLCESAMCTWGEAEAGPHSVQLEVRGEGERLAVEQRQFEVVNLVEEAEAGFRIVALGCNSGVSSDESLACSLGLERDEGIGALNVTWLIDGVVASSEAGVQADSEMQLSQPAPGEHVISVVVVEPVKSIAISGQTVAEVIEGRNAMIVPWKQAAAAGGTLGLAGVWLWAEWMNARRAEAEEARLRQLQKPSWVDDKRSLEQIWAADVAAERAKRGLWGFEYNEKTGVFNKPGWAWDLTEVERKALLASKEMPEWWLDKVDWWDDLSQAEVEKEQARWDEQRQVLRDAKLRSDRSLEQEWLREIYQEPSAAKRLKRDWIYKPEKDSWEKASWHRDEIAKQNRAMLLKADRAIDKLLDKQPVTLWGKVEGMQERFLTANSPNGEDLSRMMRLRGALYNIQQAQYESEKVAAELDALDAQAQLMRAERMRNLAGQASLAVTVGWLWTGAVGLMGVASAAEAAAAMSGAMMKLGAFRLTMNLFEGVTVGYLEGGFNAAVVGGMKRTLPINTMSLYLGPRMPGDKDPGWKRIGISVLQDVGNAFTLKRGLAQYKQIAKRAGASLSSVYQRMTGSDGHSLRMPAIQDPKLAEMNAQWWAERAKGQGLVNDFNKTLREMNAATSREIRRKLSEKLTEQAIQINQNYAAKSILKVIKRPSLTQAFDQRIQRIYRVVDHRMAKAVNAAGITRGGRAFTSNDMLNFRNASSYGTVGMDRDVGLNEMLVQKWQGVVNQAQPGTSWHAHAVSKLREAQRASQLMEGGKRISLSTFNEKAQKIYDHVYKQVTGADAKQSMQSFTTSRNVEAYKDIGVLQNNPVETPFSGRWAGQTGSVSAVKVYENFETLSKGEAVQESARGLAKDISTKLIPVLRAKPNVDPSQIAYWQGMRELLSKGGEGSIRPGELLQALGTPDERGMIRMAEQVSGAIQGAIQY